MRTSSPGEVQFGEFEWGLQNWLQRKRLRSLFVHFFFLFPSYWSKNIPAYCYKPSGGCMVNSRWEGLSQEIRDPENIPLPNLQLRLLLISLVYHSLRWYLGKQHRSSTGQFPHCYNSPEISLQATPNPSRHGHLPRAFSWSLAPGSRTSGPRERLRCSCSSGAAGKGQARESPRLLPAQAAELGPHHPSHGAAPAATQGQVLLGGAAGTQDAARASAGRSPQPPQPLGPACSRERGRLRRLCAHPPLLYFFLRK